MSSIENTLSISLLQKRTPELLEVGRVDVYQAVEVGRKAVINDHGLPRAVVPEVEAEHATVASFQNRSSGPLEPPSEANVHPELSWRQRQ